MTPRTLLCAVFFAVGLLVQGQADAAGDVVIQRFGAAPNGMGPFTPLVADASGYLYGAAAQGGKYNQGIVYKLSPPSSGQTSWTQTPIYSFPPSKGIGQPQGALLMGANGALYGTTGFVGNNYGCTVFQLTPPATGSTTWTEADLYKTGSCVGPIINDASGVLYGLSASGNGSIFALTPPPSGSSGWTMTTVYSFASCPATENGTFEGTLVAGTGGVLYGTVPYCSSTKQGGVFELTPPTSGQTAWGESAIYAGSFDTLSLGSNGVLYGSLPDPALPNAGISIYALTPPVNGQSTWTVTSVDSSQNTAISGNLGAGPLPGTGGSLYGTTTSGGAYGFGAAFKLSPPAAGKTVWRATVLHDFSGIDGGFTQASLIKGPGGLLYGVAAEGGASGNGTVFSLAPSSVATSGWIETPLYDFPGVAAEAPNSPLVGDGTGALYGTTAGGYAMTGVATSGVTVFKLTPPATGQTDWGYQQIYTFYNGISPANNPPNPALPQSPLIIGKDGSIYGAIPTESTGIFKLTPPAPGTTNWTETTIGTLESGTTYGPSPITSLVQAPDGTLYGAAGYSADAYVFSLSPLDSSGSDWELQDIFDCNYDTCDANMFVAVGSDGNLLVTDNAQGYSGSGGAIFELTPPAAGQGPSWSQTNLYNFTNGAVDGGKPNGPLLPGPGGVFYGTTLVGGGATSPYETGGYGTVFAFAPPRSGQTAWTYTVLYSFTGGLDGAAPQSNLMLGKDGALYGITGQGGETGTELCDGCQKGTVFKLTPLKKKGDAWTHHVLHRFSGGRDGLEPITGLMLNTDGKLYGTTPAGGGYGWAYVVDQPTLNAQWLPGTGTVFQVTP